MSPRARPRVLGVKWRWVLLYWVVQGAVASGVGLLLVAEPMGGWADLRDLADRGGFWVFVGAIIGGIMLCQATLLMPVRRPLAVRTSRGRAIVRHAVAGLALAWILAWIGYGFNLALASLIDSDLMLPWGTIFSWVVLVGWAVIGTALACVYRRGTPVLASYVTAACAAGAIVLAALYALKEVADGLGADTDTAAVYGVSAGVVGLLSWAVGTPLVAAFCRRGSGALRLSRLASRLFLGTAIEAGAIIPIDVMVRRKSDCYCGEGTFYAWILCLSAGFFAVGPVIFFVPLMRRRRCRRLKRCGACGYDMTGCPEAERCPECGCGWRAR